MAAVRRTEGAELEEHVVVVALENHEIARVVVLAPHLARALDDEAGRGQTNEDAIDTAQIVVRAARSFTTTEPLETSAEERFGRVEQFREVRERVPGTGQHARDELGRLGHPRRGNEASRPLFSPVLFDEPHDGRHRRALRSHGAPGSKRTGRARRHDRSPHDARPGAEPPRRLNRSSACVDSSHLSATPRTARSGEEFAGPGRHDDRTRHSPRADERANGEMSPWKRLSTGA